MLNCMLYIFYHIKKNYGCAQEKADMLKAKRELRATWVGT